MRLLVNLQDLRNMIREKCDEIISDISLAYELYLRLCEIENDDRFEVADSHGLCKDCEHYMVYADGKGYCYRIHHCRKMWIPGDWFCADWEQKREE